MEVKQIYEFVNETVKEVLGDEAIVQEDLSNVVDIGNAVFDGNAFDKYVRSLVNHIGRVIFVNRKYNGSAPSVLMDGWEYGSILQKISSEMPEAEENESWELIDGASYDPNIFRKPVAEQKFFNKKTTFEIDRSITEKQVKQSFSSAEQLNGFISMLYNEVDKAMTVMTDNLIMRTINNFTGETLHNAFPGGTYSDSHIRAVNLLAEYNTQYGTSLTKDKCMVEPAFIRFAAYRMGLYKDRLARISTLFNIGGAQRFTPNDMLHFVTLSDFNTAANIFLQSDVYHKVLIKVVKILCVLLIEVVSKFRLRVIVSSNSSFEVSYTKSITVKHNTKNTVERNSISTGSLYIDSRNIRERIVSTATLPERNSFRFRKSYIIIVINI